MSALTVAQGAAKKLGLKVPTELYSATEREWVELRDIIEDMADRIAEGHDWQLLSRVATLTGDDSTTAFNLPSDYDRMTQDSQVWSDALESPLTHISSLNKWQGLQVQSYDFVINAWTIYGGQMHITPALADAVEATFFYQSNLIVEDATGANTTNVTTFSDDAHTFRLDEGLLELGVIWRWKAYKGQTYAEEMEDYQEKLERLVARDKGANKLRIGRVRLPNDITIAYPQTISG